MIFIIVSDNSLSENDSGDDEVESLAFHSKSIPDENLSMFTITSVQCFMSL